MTIERGVLAPVRHHFISPHYDDIALSSGALAARLAANNKMVQVELLFGQDPDQDEPLSSFAAAMHAGWNLTASEVIAGRRAEEAAAAEMLGFTSAFRPFRDAIYRGHRYTNDEMLFAAPVENEADLPEHIIASLALPPTVSADTRFYAPLAVGGHVDHRHACAAGIQLARAGWDVWFYEDLPYALKPRALEQRLLALAADAPMEPGSTVPAEPFWSPKIDGVLAYPSQLETIFRQYLGVGTSRAEIDAALRLYAERIGGGTAAERFWWLLS